MQMRNAILAVSACAGLALSDPPGTPRTWAATRDGADATQASGLELIAFEVPGCAYCPIFRRDVAPSYAASRAGRLAPLRYVDLNDAAADRLSLSGPITIVPTLVLMRDGVEVGRITGYVGPEAVHRLLDTMLPSD